MIESYLKHLENKKVYVVGGAIRDRILKRYSPDIDIVVPPGTGKVAARFAEKMTTGHSSTSTAACRRKRSTSKRTWTRKS